VGSTLVGDRERVRQQELASYHLDTAREPDALVLRFRDDAAVYGTAAHESDVDVAPELDRLIPLLTPTTK
jgi:hypothetical protein